MKWTIDYNKLGKFIDESVEAHIDHMDLLKKLKYEENYNVEFIVDHQCHRDFEYFWFYKYGFPRSLNYISSFKDKNFVGLGHKPTIDMILFMEDVLNHLYLEIPMPFTLEGDFYNIGDDLFYDERIDLYEFNELEGFTALNTYIDDVMPQLKRKCDFEYNLTNDVSIYNDLFIRYYVIAEMVGVLFDGEYYDLINDIIDSGRSRLLHELKERNI